MSELAQAVGWIEKLVAGEPVQEEAQAFLEKLRSREVSERRADLTRRMVQHSTAGGVAVVVVTARELQDLLEGNL